ncbi:hypothetical protein [Kitasatospora sp. NPDC098663]|uniref:hypothetical protein n=1 Tax=Kitasatospora sp. NPDC098663 TaxID=3364096 RepID=UPI00382A4E33
MSDAYRTAVDKYHDRLKAEGTDFTLPPTPRRGGAKVGDRVTAMPDGYSLDATDEETAARVDRHVSNNAWADTFEVSTVREAARAAYLEYAPEYVRFFDPNTETTVRLDEDDFTDEELGL